MHDARTVVEVEGPPPVALAVHGRADMEAALAAADVLGCPVLLASAPAAGLSAGPGWWAAMVRRGKAAWPRVAMTAVLDCADAPGAVMAAWRLGLEDVAFSGTGPVLDRLQAIALAEGVRLWPVHPLGVDLRGARDRVAVARALLDPQDASGRARSFSL